MAHLLACLLEFGGSHKNTNIYICCTEGKFFRNMIKDGLTDIKCYASLNERYKRDWALGLLPFLLFAPCDFSWKMEPRWLFSQKSNFPKNIYK